jgi:hypothetical protein
MATTPEKPRPWTKKQYAEWLKDIADRLEILVEEQRPWPKATRFTYLYVESLVKPAWARIDPTFTQRWLEMEDPAHAHDPNEPDPKHKGRVIARSERPVPPAKDAPPTSREQINASYELAFRAGDSGAIYEFAADSYEALSAPWVMEQLVRWRLEGSKSAQRQFERFMQAYWKPAGRRGGSTTLQIIRRDQEVFVAHLNRSRKAAAALHQQLADDHYVSLETVKAVIKNYGAHFDQWSKGDLRPY